MIQHVTHVSETETENFVDSLHVTRDNHEPGGVHQQQLQVNLENRKIFEKYNKGFHCLYEEEAG